MKGLDLGCGINRHPGCVGLDMNGSLERVDVVHEITKGVNLPFDENSFNQIYLSDIVEHVDDIAWLLSEVHRIGSPNANIEIQYPHYSGRNAYGDVTHRHFLGLGAFNHFIPETKEGQKYQYYKMFDRHFPFAMEDLDLKFKIDVISPLLYRAFGANIYEGYISRVLPISTVKLGLKVLKE